MVRRMMPSIRRDLRDPVRGSAPIGRQIVVSESLSNLNFWQLAGSTALNGSGTMTVGVVMRSETTTLVRDVSLFRKWSTGLRGYAPRMLAGPNRGVGTFVNTTPANVFKISTTLTMASGSFYTLVTRLNTAVGIDVFWQGVKNGTPTACATYTPATSADNLILGQAGAAGTTLVGVAAVVIAENTAVSDANITSWHSQVAAGNTWTFPGGGTTAVWYAGDIAGTNWTSQIASITLARQGTPTTATYSSPVFP